MPMNDHVSKELATEFNCMEDEKDEKRRIFSTQHLKALRWNRETNFLKPCTLTIGKCSSNTVRSFQEIVMLTTIDLWGMKSQIGLRNKLLRIIREYTVSRQGKKKGAEEKLLETSSKHF